MKKILLGLSAIIALSISGAHAQDDVAIQVDGLGPDISGGTHSVNLYGSSPDLSGGIYEVHLIVTNLSGSDQQWKITRKKISVPSSWVDQICWPPLCYNASGDVYSTPNSGSNPAPIIENGSAISLTGTLASSGTAEIIINSTTYAISFNTDLSTTASDFVSAEASNIFATHGITLTNVGNKLNFDGGTTFNSIGINNLTGDLDGVYYNELKPRITPDQGSPSYALYRYYVAEAAGGAYVDSVDLAINYVLGVQTLKPTPIVNVSPNPANDNVNISLGTIENSSIRILDVLGKTIYTENNANGTKSIDVSNFKNGVYFVMIEAPGMKTITRKLIVKH